VINSDEQDHQRILEFFGMKESEVPAMRVIRLEEDMSKFKPENPEIEPENVKSFVTAFLDGKLKVDIVAFISYKG
jgi:protein disulfide-isomerase A1